MRASYGVSWRAMTIEVFLYATLVHWRPFDKLRTSLGGEALTRPALR